MNEALKKQFTEKPAENVIRQKKFKPVVARKSALDAKVEAELANWKSAEDIEIEIKKIEDQIALDSSN